MREWFKFFFAATIILILILTVANLISGLLRSNIDTIDVIFNHFVELPGQFGKIIPVSCLIASLFSINKLKNRSELTAIFASGYSRRKFLTILVQASLVIAAFQFFSSSFIQPFAKSKKNILIKNSENKFRNLKSKGLRASTIGSGKIWYKSQNYFFSFARFNKINNTLEDIALYFLNDKSKIDKVYRAKSATFLDGNIWNFNNLKSYENISGGKFPEIKELNSKVMTILETPEDFNQLEADITTLNIIELYTYIRKLNHTGINTNEYQVIFLEKFSTSFICIVFTLIAAAGIFNSNRRASSFGKNVAFVFVFTIAYWLVNSYTLQLGVSTKLPPILATFAVPLIFCIFLGFIFNRNKELR